MAALAHPCAPRHWYVLVRQMAEVQKMQEQFSASDEAISMVVAEELDLGKQVIEVAAVASLPRNDDTIAVTSALQ